MKTAAFSRSVPSAALVSRRTVRLFVFPASSSNRASATDGGCRIRRQGGRGDRSVPGGNASAGPLCFRPPWKAGERDATQDSSSDQRAGKCQGCFGWSRQQLARPLRGKDIEQAWPAERTPHLPGAGLRGIVTRLR